MEKIIYPSVAVLLLVILLNILHVSVSVAHRQVYIVHIEKQTNSKRALVEVENSHLSYLISVKNSEEAAKASLLYSYKNVINGFSALLTPDEADKLSETDGVVSVIKSDPITYTTQTTRSWEFTVSLSEQNPGIIIDADQTPLNNSNYGQGVIVGVLDSGIWPESPSFSDEGMEPIPQSWRGICQPGFSFNSSHCNRKLIGARYYLKGYEAQYGPLNETIDFRSTRDRDGRGTHTASTVAGRPVPHTTLSGGFANGTASGEAPFARLSIYKVCWAIPNHQSYFENTRLFEDILAAFDDAISDGVHVISISIVPYQLSQYVNDGIAYGALHAAKRDIVVVASCGNIGPTPSSVRNVAPWIISVGASSIDRVFSSPVLLGNGMIIEGQTVTPHTLSKMHPLVYAGDVEIPGTTNKNTSGKCLMNTLTEEIVQGKIVLCTSGYSTNVEKGLEVKRAGGIGFILQNPLDGISISVLAHVIPATAVFSNDSLVILDYIKNTTNATARIIPVRTVLGSKPSPFMAGFSSTGPNALDPNILKTDTTAPGLNILAAWSEASSPMKLFDDDRVVKYNILSGTSMSCPHVAAHPDWSSAAVGSALMTTATRTNNVGLPITDGTGISAATPFNYGSGHFQPSKAIQPRLVYDGNYTDYLLYLCNYNSSLQTLDPSFTCPSDIPSPSDLNYPSVAISTISDGGVSVKRTVTNVGGGESVYNVTVIGYTVEITPETMKFSSAGQRQSFSILIRRQGGPQINYAFGLYTWSDGIHSVRSPIVVSP